MLYSIAGGGFFIKLRRRSVIWGYIPFDTLAPRVLVALDSSILKKLELVRADFETWVVEGCSQACNHHNQKKTAAGPTE